MNERITKLFSCTYENKVVVIETNFVQFHKLLKEFEPNCNSDRWYSDKFKEDKEFIQIIYNKEYFFQQLV
jgi:hypothetical protein